MDTTDTIYTSAMLRALQQAEAVGLRRLTKDELRACEGEYMREIIDGLVMGLCATGQDCDLWHEGHEGWPFSFCGADEMPLTQKTWRYVRTLDAVLAHPEILLAMAERVRAKLIASDDMLSQAHEYVKAEHHVD